MALGAEGKEELESVSAFSSTASTSTSTSAGKSCTISKSLIFKVLESPLLLLLLLVVFLFFFLEVDEGERFFCCDCEFAARHSVNRRELREELGIGNEAENGDEGNLTKEVDLKLEEGGAEEHDIASAIYLFFSS